jgi:uracil phosphoribosyltransferase
MSVTNLDHPLLVDKISRLRLAETKIVEFRALVQQIAAILIVEATKQHQQVHRECQIWNGNSVMLPFAGQSPTLVPILRAGLGMLDGALSLMPDASVSVVGLYRDEETLEPVAYFDKVVNDIAEREAIIIDPMLATGGSLIATIDLLKAKGCQKISGCFLVAAPEGIEALEKAHPDVDIFVASIDDCLNEQGYIMPGLGDAGDRIFGTPNS